MKKLNNNGFSLVELIVVIAIMAVLMGVLAPTLINNIEKSRESTDLQNLDTIRGAVVTAMADEATYNEIMTAADSGVVAISMGASKTASVDSINATAYPNLKDELSNIISADITMKSTRGTASGNEVFIVISQKGAVTALIAGSEADAKAYTAKTCRETKEEDSSGKEVEKPLLSGAKSASGSGSSK